MKSPASMKLCVAGVSVAAVFAVGGCANMVGQEAFQPTPIGSTWTYAQRNTGSFATQLGAGEVQVPNKLVQRVWDGKQVNAYVSSQSTLLTSDDGSWLAWVGPDEKAWARYDPPLSFFPMTIGGKFESNFQFTNASGQSVSVKYSCKVDAYEDVTVPAGTFKAFKMDCVFPSGSTDVFWLSPKLNIFVKTITNPVVSQRYSNKIS